MMLNIFSCDNMSFFFCQKCVFDLQFYLLTLSLTDVFNFDKGQFNHFKKMVLLILQRNLCPTRDHRDIFLHIFFYKVYIFQFYIYVFGSF